MIKEEELQENLLEELDYLRKENRKLEKQNLILRTITTQSMKENLRLSEEKFAKVFNLSPDIMLLIDYKTYHVIDANQYFLKTTGLTRTEIIGQDYTKLGHVIDYRDRQKLLEEIKSKGSVENEELQFLQQNKEPGVNLVSGTVIETNGKRFILIVGNNITEKKKMERRIITSESRFRNTFIYSGIGMAIVGLDGYILQANPSFCNFLGYTEQELQKLSFREVTHPEDLEENKRYYDRILTGEITNYHMEKRYIRKDNEVVWGLLSVSSAKGAYEKPIHLVAQIQDITDRKRLEKEMLRLDRLDMIGQMAAGIGHEIRNPMTSVRGFLQLMQGKKEYQSCQDIFQLMIDELDRANGIISEFLSLAKNKEVQLKPENLNDIIRSLSPLMFADAIKDDKYIKFDIKYVPKIPLDEKQIRQLILNLVRNGLDAMDSGGGITIRTLAEPGAIILQIEDQGSGIDSETQKSIGTPFFTTKDSGTGLGLAICYSIAARHNATLDFRTGHS